MFNIDIIHIAAWIYVLKHIIPFVAPPVMMVVAYAILRLTGESHKEAWDSVWKSSLKGVSDALKGFDDV